MEQFSEWVKKQEFLEWGDSVSYEFEVGERVRLRDKFTQVGEITSTVPGDGKTPWYFVRWDNGLEDRYVAEDLERE